MQRPVYLPRILTASKKIAESLDFSSLVHDMLGVFGEEVFVQEIYKGSVDQETR